MKRFSVFDRYDAPLFDLSDEVTGALRSEEINKEHKLDITTTQPLSEGMRILFRDGMLELHEFVIDDPDSHHDGASVVEGTYGCTWSMQYDLAGKDGGVLWASAEPGTLDPITARRALEIALSPQSRWEVGNVTLQAMGGASLHDGQVWDYLAKLVSVFGGEIEPRIEVDADGTIHRYVDWSARIGSEDAVRRFDYGEDCTFIRRKEAPGPRYCGIRPRGGSERTDDDGVDYSDRCGVEEEPEYDRDGIWHPANSPYVYDRAAMDDFKRPDGQGGWEYPCLTVIYDLETDGDQEELLNKAIPDVRGYVYPDTTYEANVLQFAKAGMEAHGVRLGDTVHIVDKRFGDSPLRLEARVTKMETNELDDSDVTLTIGSFGKVEDAMRGIVKSEVGPIGTRLERIENGGTIAYIETLLDAINAEINTTGGYFYVTQGQGARTYDKAVSDPLVGAEADAVVEMKGGTLRFANTRTAQGEFDWRTVLTADGINGDLVTALNAMFGTIRNQTGSIFISLDTGEFNFPGMRYDSAAGALIFGFDPETGQPDIKNRITATGQSYLINGAEVSSYGVDTDGISKMWLGVASVRERLEFQDFAWIARANGNMTLKWMGA